MDDREPKISILCLGPKGSGKTTLLKKLQDAEGVDHTYSPVPTVGTNLYDVQYVNKQGKKESVTVREIGGEMAGLWSKYLDGVDKVIFVVDTSNLCQVSAAAVQLYTLLAEPRLRRAEFTLVLSKMDAAYRQMRNEALLMLQYRRLRSEAPALPALHVLEAAPLRGAGIDELRERLTRRRASIDTKTSGQVRVGARAK